MLIYVACAIDLRDDDSFSVEEDVLGLIGERGDVAYAPWKGIICPEGGPQSNPDKCRIQELNYSVIRSAADAMLAIIGGRMSVGTIMDAVYAANIGKPVAILLHGVKTPTYLWDWETFSDVTEALDYLSIDGGREERDSDYEESSQFAETGNLGGSIRSKGSSGEPPRVIDSGDLGPGSGSIGVYEDGEDIVSEHP